MRMRARMGDDRGVAAVEFAIVSIVLLVLLFGMLSYGFVFSLTHNLNHAASEGARAANRAPAGSEITAAKARAKDSLSYDLAKTHAVIDATKAVCDPAYPQVECVTVTITYDYEAHPIVAPLFGVGVPKTLKASSKLIID